VGNNALCLDGPFLGAHFAVNSRQPLPQLVALLPHVGA